jgi:hypothetical protein
VSIIVYTYTSQGRPKGYAFVEFTRYTHTHSHTHIYTYTHIHTHTHTHTNIHTHTQIYTYTHNTHTYTLIHTNTHTSEEHMMSAYKKSDGKKIEGRRVVVDVERGR